MVLWRAHGAAATALPVLWQVSPRSDGANRPAPIDLGLGFQVRVKMLGFLGIDLSRQVGTLNG
jgi:hypothetical protein